MVFKKTACLETTTSYYSLQLSRIYVHCSIYHHHRIILVKTMCGFSSLSSAIFLVLFNTVTSLPVTSPGPTKYGVILDAGSSSTKVRVYSWLEGVHSIPKMHQSFYEKRKPGISGFDGNIEGIATYMLEILGLLENEIPNDKWSTTPVYFMATAGLRLLDENITKSIMDGVVSVMSDTILNPFMYEDNFAHILSGEEEALFAWITINQLGDFFALDEPVSESEGLVELGGGSAQIAFIPADPIYAGKMPLTVAGKEYSVYCHSHLSFGATEMFQRVAEFLIRMNPHADVLVNPCMLRGDSTVGALEGKTLTMIGGGNATLCEGILNHYLGSGDPDMCSPKPCSIGQVYQPPVRDRKFFTFGMIYIVGKFFGIVDEAGTLHLNHLQEKAREYCGMDLENVVTDYDVHQKWASRNCQDGLYIPLLFSALGFDLDTPNVRAGKTVKGHAIAWSLGGMLYEEEKDKYQEFSLSQMRSRHEPLSDILSSIMNV